VLEQYSKCLTLLSVHSFHRLWSVVFGTPQLSVGILRSLARVFSSCHSGFERSREYRAERTHHPCAGTSQVSSLQFSVNRALPGAPENPISIYGPELPLQPGISCRPRRLLNRHKNAIAQPQGQPHIGDQDATRRLLCWLAAENSSPK
jgi:hypothetical protein